ncbi:MAG TPA: hypothetical protein VH140_10170 [Candidatus Acidoferrum sp.]|nr:hypothetical protein [Candidatus Acidoferrum sp.]
MNGFRFLKVVFLFATISLRCEAAQQPDPNNNSLAAEAGTAYDGKDWAKAAKLYGQLSKSPEAPPRVRLRLGASLRELGKYADALAAFEKANAAGAALFGEYGEAAVYTAMKQPEKAFDHLEKAVQQGYAQPEVLSADPSLAALRSDPLRQARRTSQEKSAALRLHRRESPI